MTTQRILENKEREMVIAGLQTLAATFREQINKLQDRGFDAVAEQLVRIETEVLQLVDRIRPGTLYFEPTPGGPNEE